MNNQKALTQLAAYGKGRLEADDRIDVEALLEQYLEGMLEPELAHQVEQAIETDVRLAEIVERARRGGAWIDEVLVPSMRPLLDEPASPGMKSFIDDLIAR